MGIFDSLKRTMNIAGSEITITVDGKIFSQNDLVKGVVDITFPEFRLSGDSISIELKEFSYLYTSAHSKTTRYKTHEKKLLYNAFDFEPGSKFKFPFEFNLPRNCRITTDEDGWCLEVRMDIPNAVSPKEVLKLKVIEAKELFYIAEACEEILRFKEDKDSRKWDGATMKSYFQLIPPKDLKSKIDYLAFEISQTEDGSISGHILFNLQEKSIGDYFKALRGADIVRKEFYIDSSKLCVEKDQPDYQAISEIIRVKLNEVLEQHC